MTPRLCAALLLTSFLCLPSSVSAQQTDSGRVQVTVQESMGMLNGFLVQSAGRSALSDSAGVARLVLPVGRQLVTVTRTGFVPARLTVFVVRDSLVIATVTATMSNFAASNEAMGNMAMPMAEVRVSATRTEKLAGESPIRVEVVEEMEVDEKTLMSPSGISMLLNETPGLRVQAAAPGLGTGSVRILGLPGQYTVMLADGLPLYGASSSALGPLDISPVDLQRVEIIKGAASALYGGQALGGVINLVSKPPTGKKELLLNRRTMGVTDGATWLSHRFGSAVGVSLLGAGTVQSAQDVDDDGWADQSRANRWSVRPRLHAVDSSGRSLFVTAGLGHDDRAGGTFGAGRTPDSAAFREALRSDRADVGATVRVPLQNGGNVSMRLAVANNARGREFGAGAREDDRTTTGFLELTRSFDREQQVIVLGGVLQLDNYSNALNDTFDHKWTIPGAFVTAERGIGPVTLSASVRADAHPDAGVQVTERVALLARPVEGWSVRGSLGTGYTAPTGRTEETEAMGLRGVRATRALDPERSVGAMLDVNGKVAGAEVLLTAYGSSIADAVQLAEVPGNTGQTELLNAPSRTRVGGVEALAVWRFSGGKFIANYGHARGSRPDALTGTREALPLLPRHRVGGDLMLERPGVYRGGIEGTWYGRQSLDDNPFRTTSKPYFYVMAIAAKQFGPVEIVANFENLLNVRQTDTDPLVRRNRGMGGRWTTDVWAPLEGFMANVALRYRWQ
ncbi:MAG TPA: TonB-dependent receptor [Gemmatimonas sp.]|nr:TonB-dependent receptor [Gemmatimonas sp.]